jgi:hypothetical protein
MTTLTIKDYININGTTFWHYTFGGKYSATEWIVVDGIHYYNTNKPLENGFINPQG